jgi:hypothetical protein
LNNLSATPQDHKNFVVVTSAQINHDVFVAEEEHDGAGIVQLVPYEKKLKLV